MARILIAGGGVAGVATALALQQAGFDPVVHEAHRSGGEDAGAFLTVMANGLAALEKLGAATAVEAVSFPAGQVALFGPDGREQGRRPINGPARTVRRAALYRALQELAVARGIPVRHGKRLVTATSTTDCVRAEFADTSTAEGDALVGADGIHSVVRRLIDPAAPEPRFTGQHVIYGYATGNVAGSDPDAYHMNQGRRSFFGFTAPDEHTWWFARVPGRAGGSPDWRQVVLDAVRDDGTAAAEIVAATEGEVVGGDSYDIPVLPRWHRDRMVLAGDAAHAAFPATAQGASMALEDAVALGAAFRHSDDPFAAYEAERRPKAEETVAASAARIPHTDGSTPASG